MIVKIATAAPKPFSPKTKQTISVVYDPAQGITTAQILADTTTIGIACRMLAGEFATMLRKQTPAERKLILNYIKELFPNEADKDMGDEP